MRVLLVEDHPTMRFAVRILLRLKGDVDVVDEADDAEQALRLVRRLKPDLVVLDLDLPGETDGVELCREIKDHSPDPPRVLVYSAYNSREAVHSCFLSGADSYVHKREEHAKLLEAVRETHAGKKVWLLGGEAEEAKSRLQAVANRAALTRKEREVLSLVQRGHTNARIAEELSIALPTVKTHVGNILKKLGSKSRKELL